MYQNYKSTYFLRADYENKMNPIELYKQLITFDPCELNQYEHSFTFFHWSLIEAIIEGEIDIKDLPIKIAVEIIYNILPGGNTALHLLQS
jgi:hypothetical protein